jgi:predicted ATPase/class 3 adenylate cyclase
MHLAAAQTITFMFTDIEGSTHLWERHPAAMQLALARHDHLLRQAVEAHQGRIVKSTGDGLHAAFNTALSASTAALAAQQALWAEPWPELDRQGLRVRMALHTGEAEARAGDYFGSAVNRAARLLAIGHGGQVLLSAATTELVRDQLPAGASLLDLGQHRLKDLVQPEHVFQLIGPGLPASFSALRSLDSLPGNLPVQLTSFVGREREMAEVQRLLAKSRLLTLTGPGGTGKTRLALQAAAEATESFSHGVWLAELAALSDPALLPQTVASVLGVREQPGRALLDTLQDYLRPKRLLLLLDNCEHLMAASAQLASRLLPACPQLKLLTTSREALSVAGEVTFQVPSLSLPEALDATPEVLAQSEAGRLFVERAQAVRPGFTLTHANAGAVTQICRRLDGIPLALELAAARVKLLTPEQIAARLDDRFRLLTGGSRSALPRQQTLQALIDWSCDLLSEPERAAWRQLSVFAGGFTLQAAEAVIGVEALDWLAPLVDKSLVKTEEHGETGEMRYRLLETIRQYGRDRLVEAGEAIGARDRHLAYYLQFAVEVEPRLGGPELVPALNQLVLEHDNLRAALEWALERNPETALQIAASLKYFWQRRDHTGEGIRWLRDGLARAEGSTRAGPSLRAKGLLAVGTIEFGVGELTQARSSLEQSVMLSRQAGDVPTLGLALGMLGFTTIWLGDEEATRAVLAEDASLIGAANQTEVEALYWSAQAQWAGRRQDFAASRTYVQASMERAQQLGSPWFIAITWMGLAALESHAGQATEARAYLEEAEKLFRTIGDRHMVTSMQSERAHIERRAGHYAEAAALYANTLSRWQEYGERPALLHELECLAFIAVAQSHDQRAARLLGAAESLRAAYALPMTAFERAEYEAHVAQLRTQMGETELAKEWAGGQALSLDEAVAYALAGEIRNS